MNGLESNVAVMLKTPGAARESKRVSAEAKLAIAEFLLTCEDLAECSHRCMQWLGEHAGARKAICLAVDSSRKRLVGMAGWGVPSSEVTAFSLDLEEHQHPLIAALSKTKAVALRGDFRYPLSHSVAVAFDEDTLAAIPLTGMDANHERTGVGLLLVSPFSSSKSPELRWLTDLFGPALRRRLNMRSASDMEDGLRRERARLYNILNTVQDPIILTNTEGGLIISNRSAEYLFGTREQESEGRRRAVALNNMFLSAALSQHAIEDSASTRRELPLVDPVEGSDLFFEFASTAFSDVHEGTGIVTILRNVGDLRRTTQELEENYRKLRAAEADVRAERDRLDLIITSVAEPILVTDPEGKIVMMNDPAERLFTMPSAATPEAAQSVRANDANFSSFVSNLFFMGEGRQHHGGISLVEPETGKPMPVEAVSTKLISEQGELMGVVTTLHDQSEALEKARLYEQLRHASEVLEEKVRSATAELVRQNEVLRRQHIEVQQASAAKSQFLASVSHELRTPLNSIIGYTRILLQGVSGSVNSQQIANLARLDSNAQNLLSLINQLLDITRIEAGKMSVKPSTVSISGLINDVMSEMEPLILQSKLKVTTELAPDAPSVRSDPEKIKQIVLNLLMNALKFTPAGWVKVSMTYHPIPNQIAVTVADSGMGIAEADQEKIFEEFRRTESSVARGYAGVGLGLSISRRLAQLLGGKITVTSRLGQGASFTLLLPRDAKFQ